MSDQNLPQGKLDGRPQYVRVVALGKCMILDADRRSIWQPADGSVLIPDVKVAQWILGDHNYECDVTVPVEPNLYYVRAMEAAPAVTLPFVIPVMEEAPTAEEVGEALPDPELPPGLDYPVRLLAAALPQYVPNPLHVSLDVWLWLRAHEGIVRPALFPEDYAKPEPAAPPPAQRTPNKRPKPARRR